MLFQRDNLRRRFRNQFLSEPARSTKDIFETLLVVLFPGVFWLKIRLKTACDLELVAFMFVAATVRVLFPSSMI